MVICFIYHLKAQSPNIDLQVNGLLSINIELSKPTEFFLGWLSNYRMYVTNTFVTSIYQLPCKIEDQARVRLGRNSHPRGRNFALNGTQGEVGVSLKIFFFFRETHFHSVTTQMQAVVTLSDNLLPLIVFLFPLNGNSMCNG